MLRQGGKPFSQYVKAGRKAVQYVITVVWTSCRVSFFLADPDLAISVDLEREEQEKNGRRKNFALSVCLSSFLHPFSLFISIFSILLMSPTSKLINVCNIFHTFWLATFIGRKEELHRPGCNVFAFAA